MNHTLIPIRLPITGDVSISEVVNGIFEIEGQLELLDDVLSLTYQTKKPFSGYSAPETIEIPTEEIRSVELKRRSLVLRPERLSVLEGIPGAHRGKLTLKIKREHQERAKALVSALQKELSITSLMSTENIPFKLPDVGLREINGVVYVEDGFLVLETENALFGEFDKDRQIIKIEPGALESVRLKRGVFKDQLHIEPKQDELLTLVPGKHETILKLKMWTRYRTDVKHLINEVTRLQDMDMLVA